jgi:Cu/Ag efflux protein CusF
MKTVHGAVATLFAAILTAALCLGQAAAARKSYTFHGKVVSVNKDTQRLTVNGEKVEGWMAAMTMNYKVDDWSIAAKLKPGDQITATVYDGDHVLHNVTASGPAFGRAANNQQSPARHEYRVPIDRLPAFLRAQPYGVCQSTGGNTVSCQGPALGSFGQVELDASGKPYVNGHPAPLPSYPIPATPPPAGVAPAQRAQADEIWNRVSALPDNDPREMPLLYQCALMGDRRCEATLGIRYQDGGVVKADDHAAAYWFGLAAAQNHRAAQYALGGMYLEGEGGLPKDLAKGTDLLIKSANQGYSKAQLAVGIAYEFGEGVPRDRAKAIALIRQSGEWNELADILADPRTPKSFANEDAFGAYLASIRNAQFAAAWAQARRPSQGYDGNAIGVMNAAKQRRAESERNVPH